MTTPNSSPENPQAESGLSQKLTPTREAAAWLENGKMRGHLHAMVRAILLSESMGRGVLTAAWAIFKERHPESPTLEDLVETVEADIPPESFIREGLAAEDIPQGDSPLTFGDYLRLQEIASRRAAIRNRKKPSD